MNKSIFVLVFLMLVTNDSNADAGHNELKSAQPNELYLKLEKLYNESDTPFDILKIESKSLNSPLVYSCVGTDGKDTVRADDFVAIRYAYTVKRDNGPLDPAQVHAYPVLTTLEIINIYKQYDAKFNNGVLNFDNSNTVISEEDLQKEFQACVTKPKTKEEIFLANRYKISNDNTSYQSYQACPEGGVETVILQYRKSDNYIIIKSDIDNSYAYCWKE